VSAKLREEIDVELAQLRHLLDVHSDLIAKCHQNEPTRVELSALGMMLHSFYMGAENIFKRVAVEIDGGLPKSESWHRDLLANMAQASPRRTPVISAGLRETLKDYVGFRHVFRNAYSFHLEWSEMAPLVLNLQATLDSLAQELGQFIAQKDAGEPKPPTT
jgi:hypothetical protein